MLDQILELDRALFLKINAEWTNAAFDFIMPYWREAKYWVPLYLVIIGALLYRFSWKVWPWLLTVGIMMALSDQLSSNVIKPLVARPRPCNDAVIGAQVRSLLGYCRDSFSFTSSHAVNHFCIATFIIYTLKPYWGKLVYLFWLWAFSIIYGQVYVGVHFPVDVFCGSLLGLLLGWSFARMYNRYVGMPVIKKSINK